VRETSRFTERLHGKRAPAAVTDAAPTQSFIVPYITRTRQLAYLSSVRTTTMKLRYNCDTTATGNSCIVVASQPVRTSAVQLP